MNWDLGWADYLTSQRDFIVARLVEENMEEVVFDEQQQLGKATVTKALGVLRLFSLPAPLSVFIFFVCFIIKTLDRVFHQNLLN